MGAIEFIGIGVAVIGIALIIGGFVWRNLDLWLDSKGIHLPINTLMLGFILVGIGPIVALFVPSDPNLDRCEAVSESTVQTISEGLHSTNVSLRAARAVKSHDDWRYLPDDMWFVAADLQGPGIEGPDDIAVWGIGDVYATSLPGELHVMAGPINWGNDVAKQYSNWGIAREDSFFSSSDDGFNDVVACTKAALRQ